MKIEDAKLELNNVYKRIEILEDLIAELERVEITVKHWLDWNPIIGKEVGEVYYDYLAFCTLNNIFPLPKQTFSKRLKQEYNIISEVKWLYGKSVRVYCKY